MTDQSVELVLSNFYNELLKAQEPLGEPFQKILYDNLWDLYVRDEKEEKMQVLLEATSTYGARKTLILQDSVDKEFIIEMYLKGEKVNTNYQKDINEAVKMSTEFLNGDLQPTIIIG